MATIESMAREFAGYLTTQQRGETTIVVKTEDAPEWVGEIIHAIHGDLFPDDWTYATIKECAEYLAEYGDDGDRPEVDIYTHSLLSWLKDYPDAVDSCDTAAEEMGGPGDNIVATIQQGQYYAIGQIHYALIGTLQERADVQPDDDEAEGY